MNGEIVNKKATKPGCKELWKVACVACTSPSRSLKIFRRGHTGKPAVSFAPTSGGKSGNNYGNRGLTTAGRPQLV